MPIVFKGTDRKAFEFLKTRSVKSKSVVSFGETETMVPFVHP